MFSLMSLIRDIEKEEVSGGKHEAYSTEEYFYNLLLFIFHFLNLS